MLLPAVRLGSDTYTPGIYFPGVFFFVQALRRNSRSRACSARFEKHVSHSNVGVRAFEIGACRPVLHCVHL